MGEDSGRDSLRVGEWYIPVALAITAWFASALAVIGYTLTAFGETADASSITDSKTVTTKGKNADVKPVDRGHQPASSGNPWAGQWPQQ